MLMEEQLCFRLIGMNSTDLILGHHI